MVDSNRLPFLHQFKPFCILIIHGTIFHQSRIGFYIRIKEEFIPAICACLWHHAFCQCYDIATLWPSSPKGDARSVTGLAICVICDTISSDTYFLVSP